MPFFFRVYTRGVTRIRSKQQSGREEDHFEGFFCLYIRAVFYTAFFFSLRLDRVGSLEHVVNVLEVVNILGDGVDGALGLVALLEVGLLSEIAHLNKI